MSRPRFWLYLAGPALLGIVYGSSKGEILTLHNALLFLYFLIPANIFLYGVNDYFDRRIDRKNPKKKERETLYRRDLKTGALTAASGLLGLLWAPILEPKAAAAILLFLFLSTAYSAPPVRFKSRPFLDSLSNGLYILPGVLTFTHLTGALPPFEVIAGGWTWTMAMHTFSAIPDIGPDREAGVETTATFLGRPAAYTYCIFLWFLAALFFLKTMFPAGLLLCIYPVLTASAYIADMDDSRVYWWFPYLNGFIGMLFTLYGLVVIHLGGV